MGRKIWCRAKRKRIRGKWRELRLKQRELEKNKDSVGTIVEDTSNLSLGLENFDIDKNIKN